MNKLANLQKIVGKRKKIVGRGYGSGKGGHTSGRGNNGQNSRAGANLRPTFEGGQNEIIHRLPVLRGRKRAKTNPRFITISLTRLNRFEDGDTVSYESLVEKKIIRDGQPVKIVATGKLDKKIKVKDIDMTSKAKKLIQSNK